MVTVGILVNTWSCFGYIKRGHAVMVTDETIYVSKQVKTSLDNLKKVLNLNDYDEVIDFLIQEWLRLGEIEQQ